MLVHQAEGDASGHLPHLQWPQGSAMRDLTPWFMLLFAGESVVTMAISVPLMRGWVKPNPAYGIRTPRTLSDEGLWYRSNQYGGKLMFRTGLVQLIAIVALFGVPSLRANFI